MTQRTIAGLPSVSTMTLGSAGRGEHAPGDDDSLDLVGPLVPNAQSYEEGQS